MAVSRHFNTAVTHHRRFSSDAWNVAECRWWWKCCCLAGFTSFACRTVSAQGLTHLLFLILDFTSVWRQACFWRSAWQALSVPKPLPAGFILDFWRYSHWWISAPGSPTRLAYSDDTTSGVDHPTAGAHSTGGPTTGGWRRTGIRRALMKFGGLHYSHCDFHTGEGRYSVPFRLVAGVEQALG